MKLINRIFIIIIFMLPFTLGAEIKFDVTASCSNLHNGAIDLTATGSGGPFAYQWSNGATTEDINNLGSGTYTVTITFLGGSGSGDCEFEYDVIVPGSSPMTIEFAWTEPCPGSEFGDLEVDNITGGQSPFSYLWSTGHTGSLLEDLTAGNYCVTITDANGCTAEDCFNLENAPGCSNDDCPYILYGILVDRYPCFGNDNGGITVYMDQGYTAYSYLWSTGATSASLSFIPAGTYCVTVTDINACTEVACKTLNEQTNSLPVALGPIPASGPNAFDGAINSAVSGGIPPYNYLWTGPNGFTSTSAHISGLEPGDYCLRVRSRGCYETTECVTLDYQCPYLILGIKHYGFIQCEGETGTFTVILTNDGTAPYDILWSTGETTETITDLEPGYYSVTVSDAVGCSSSFGTTMYVKNEPIVISGDVQNDMCDESSGSITLNIEGGEGPLTYLWDNGSTQKDRSNLSAGTYCVTVTDEDGCSAEECFTVGVGSNQLDVQVVGKENVGFCLDEGGPGPGTFCDGSIDIEVNGSSGPFTYSWVGPDGYTSSSEDPSNLCPGYYLVTVTTPSGCVGTSYVLICCCEVFSEDPNGPTLESCYGSNNTQISMSGVVSQVSTTGADDGSINLTVTGGTWTFYYTWTGPGGFSSPNQDISGLAPGEYCVTVNDGCKKKSECFEVVDCSLENLSVSGSVTKTCTGYSYGSISTSVSGGSAPYTYQWSNGSTSSSPGNLGVGEYCVTVTDKNGCKSEEACFTVSAKSVERSDCSFYCNGNLLYSLEADYVYDENDCRIIHWYCSDGYYLGWENIGIATVNINPFSCQADVICYNGQILTTEYGTSCRDCIIFQDGSSIVSCHIDYCYFPQSNVSYVTSVNEHNSVTSIQIGDGSCKVEVWNDCDGSQLIDDFYDCNNIPFSDGDCFSYGIQPGNLFEGSFGNCSGFAGTPDDKNKPEYDIRDYVDLKSLPLDRDSLYYYIKKYSEDQVNILYADDCKDFAVSFKSPEGGDSKIRFYDESMNLLMNIETKVIEGINNLYLEGIDLSSKTTNDSFFVKVILPDGKALVEKIPFDCSTKKKLAEPKSDKLAKLDIEVYPNPFTDDINISLTITEAQMIQVRLFDLLGKEVLHKDFDLNSGSNTLNLQISQQLPSGIYQIQIQSENGLQVTHKIVHTNE